MTMTISEALFTLERMVGKIEGSTNYDALALIRSRLEVTNEMAKQAALWLMCTSTHGVGHGEEVRCHVNVGLNYWKDGEWVGFQQCSPDELKAALVAAMGDEHDRA